jgi:hypothetical protein
MRLAIAACAFALVSCTPAPVPTKPSDAQQVIDSLVYAKASNGLCFGVATVSRIDARLTVAEHVLIVPVDCSKVGK